MDEYIRWAKYASRRWLVFQGRARRKEYWSFILIFGVITWLLETVAKWLNQTVITQDRQSMPLVIILVVLSLLVLAVKIWYGLGTLSVMVRRLHDVGKSGWWAFASAGVLFAGIALVSFVGPEARGGVMLAALAVSLVVGIVIFIWTVKNGQYGDNRYGPDPKA